MSDANCSGSASGSASGRYTDSTTLTFPKATVPSPFVPPQPCPTCSPRCPMCGWLLRVPYTINPLYGTPPVGDP